MIVLPPVKNVYNITTVTYPRLDVYMWCSECDAEYWGTHRACPGCRVDHKFSVHYKKHKSNVLHSMTVRAFNAHDASRKARPWLLARGWEEYGITKHKELEDE